MPVAYTEELTEAQTEDLHALYQREWWTEGRELADVRRMLAGTDEIVAFADGETAELVAFARVITDYVYKAWIYDVIVAPDRRGEGLGRRLLDRLLAHPRLADVRDFELYCQPDLVDFYERWGFTDAVDTTLMRRREADREA